MAKPFNPKAITSLSSVREKQALFMWCLGQLITHAYFSLNVELAGKELLRTPAQAATNAKSGAGIKNSLHLLGLAIDIALFDDTTGPNGNPDGIPDYQTATRAYEMLGVYWESLHPLCRWGGRFTKADGNHFSITHGGVQ